MLSEKSRPVIEATAAVVAEPDVAVSAGLAAVRDLAGADVPVVAADPRGSVLEVRST